MKTKRRDKNFNLLNIKCNWKPVAVNINVLQDEDMTGFAGLEEITNYKTVKLSKKGKVTSRTVVSKETEQGDSENLFKTRDAMKVSRKNTKRKRRVVEEKGENEAEKEDCKISKLAHKKKNTEVEVFSKLSKNDENQYQSDENVLAQMRAWDGLFVPVPVLQALWELGFDSPTPIQTLSLPSAIRDRMDILGAAQTGSGKTLAFGIPLLHFILEAKSKKPSNQKNLYALVLTPTRELAIQVKNHLEAAARHTSIKVAVVVGGMAPEKQTRVLCQGPELVVATPGRLWELYEEGNDHLQQIPFINHLVIDEADRMAEKGHFAELQQIIDLIKRDGENKCQAFVFSATLTLTHEIPKRLRLKKKKYKITSNMKLESIMSLLGIHRKPKIIDLSSKVGTADSLTETRIYCDTDQKDIYLYYFWLNHPGRTLVFCNSIDCVRRLQSLFELLNCNPYSLHASMQQRQRLKNLDRFKNKEHCLLLASDVAARGLDISNVQHVVHYQVPRTAEIYVHRSGRTARAQKEGLSVMLISPEEVQLYRKLSRTLNRENDLPEFPVESNLYSTLEERVSCAQQLDKLLHHQSRAQAQSRWIQQAAEAFEIDIDEDNELSKVVHKNSGSVAEKKRIQVLKKKLQVLLKSFTPPGYFSKYPTQTGELSISKAKMKRNAMELFKSKNKKKDI